MKFSRIVFVILLPFVLISCLNRVENKPTIEQEENTFPSTEYQKTRKPSPKLERQKPVEKQLDKELKKKRLRKIDTLKPVVAIP